MHNQLTTPFSNNNSTQPCSSPCLLAAVKHVAPLGRVSYVLLGELMQFTPDNSQRNYQAGLERVVTRERRAYKLFMLVLFSAEVHVET